MNLHERAAAIHIYATRGVKALRAHPLPARRALTPATAAGNGCALVEESAPPAPPVPRRADHDRRQTAQLHPQSALEPVPLACGQSRAETVAQ